jgi:hypothetical protein
MSKPEMWIDLPALWHFSSDLRKWRQRYQEAGEALAFPQPSASQVA